ncbi:MAG: hypothetical protein GX175_11970 [Halanaerobiaceae bacterium]|jgi:uncharacterized integral membrane protein|nr:hypothetical protein [Halanaerobiaceae bacterium]
MDKTRVYLTESLSTKERKSNGSVSGLGIILNLLGYITIICGISIGFYMTFSSKIIDSISFIIVCLGSIITGFVLIAFAKIIKLLQEIKKNLEK